MLTSLNLELKLSSHSLLKNFCIHMAMRKKKIRISRDNIGKLMAILVLVNRKIENISGNLIPKSKDLAMEKRDY